MKNHLRTLLCAAGLLYAGGATAQNTIPNAGFETWQTRGNLLYRFDSPQGWLTADDVLYQLLSSSAALAPRLATKSGDKYAGSSAIQLAPKVALGYNIPSVLLLGDRFRVTLDDLNNPASITDITRSRGIPFTARPTQLSFWYKFAGESTDQAQVALALSKGNLKTTGFLVGSGGSVSPNLLTPGTTTYKQFTLPIAYSVADAPDSLRLGFIVGGNQTFSSSATLTVDELVFSTITANANPAVAGALSVYPNPSSDGVFSLASLQNPGVATAALSVTDALGKVVLQQAAAPTSEANGRQLDLRGKPAGVYLLRLNTAEGVVVRKLQLQ